MRTLTPLSLSLMLELWLRTRIAPFRQLLPLRLPPNILATRRLLFLPLSQPQPQLLLSLRLLPSLRHPRLSLHNLLLSQFRLRLQPKLSLRQSQLQFRPSQLLPLSQLLLRQPWLNQYQLQPNQHQRLLSQLLVLKSQLLRPRLAPPLRSLKVVRNSTENNGP